MRPYKEQNLYFAVVSFGFASMATQILLLRELMVVFYGNELSIGIMLSAWLFWAAAGSFAMNNISQYLENKLRLQGLRLSIFHLLLLSVSIITPFLIYLIRNIKNILGISTGEIIGLFPMALASFALLAPICLVFGSLFAASCRLISAECGEIPKETGKIYLLEAAGAAAGGLAFTFLFVYLFNPLQTALLCGALNVCAVLLLADRKQAPIRWWFTFLFMACLIFLSFHGASSIDLRMRQVQWKNYELIAVKDSGYGNIVLARLGSQLNLFENGLLVASTDDPLTAEEGVHYALLEHPDPKRVLLIGGALTGALDETLKHPVDTIDCVELDPDLIKVGRDNYPQGSLKAFADPRVTFHYADGRLFVKRLAGKKFAKYDAVILALPNPFTAQINRFYSLEFYREVKAVIGKKGVFSFRVASSENYISPAHAQFLGSLYRTLKSEFADVKVLPGDNNFFLASNSKEILTYDYGLLLKRSRARNLGLKYVNEYYLPSRFDRERIKYLEETIKSAGTAKINRDFRPIGYFYDMVLWSAQSRFGLGEGLENLDKLNAKTIAAALAIIFAVLFALQAKLNRFKYPVVALSIGVAGLSGMLLQIAIILAFQVIYGYVYQEVGLIFASFMLGLIAGSLSAIKILEKGVNLSKIYNSAQLSLSIYSVILPAIFLFLGKAHILFTGLPAVIGFIGGLQFPLANGMRLRRKEYAGKTAGFLYAIDLLGACAGALLTSAILIPVIGINAACYLTGFVNFLVYLLLIVPAGAAGRD